MRAVFVLLVTLLVTSCGPGAPEPTPAGDQGQTTQAAPLWPTTRWPMSTPAVEGLDPAGLEMLDAEFAAGDHGYVDSVLIVKNGHVVFERAYTHDYELLFEGVEDQTPGPYNYYDPAWHPYHKQGPLHTMQSVSKSVTSALIGIAIRRGEIPGVDVRALPYFHEFSLGEPDPRWEALTLKHLLTMTAGIAWDESTVAYTDPANTCAGMERSDDWVQFVLDQPMTDDPGARFVYNSGATVLLAQVIKEATGLEAHEYAATHLFGPLGITSSYWKQTPTGLTDTEGGLYLTARDLAKFGILYLHDGVWDGERLLPEGWVAASTRPLIDTAIGTDRGRRYGYQWWLLPYGDPADPTFATTAIGLGGQLLILVPEQRLIGVFTGWNIYDHPTLPPLLALDRLLDVVSTP